MKIAVTATGPSLEDQVEARFGRCAYFLIIDSDTMEFEAVENPNIALGGGAGIQSAQMMAERGVETVLTGNCGPNAFSTFGAVGIQVIVDVSGIVRQVVEQFKTGAFSASSGPSVQSHFGMGGGGGRGMGGGGGRGMGGGGGRGMGRGMGMGAASTDPSSAPAGMPQQAGGQMSKEQELEMLKTQAQATGDQLRGISGRINELKKEGGAFALIAVVDLESCSACGICMDVCPADAITVEKIVQIDAGRCTGCARCVAECPQSALSLQKA
jgi:predicted Fe-Mo cluster-binding NifX family protein/ferredoxin